MRIAACALMSLTLSSASTRAEDWPQFRGPTGEGQSITKKLPTTWSATENVAWKAPIPGTGWSSPSIYQGRLYLTTAEDQGSLNLSALCLDEATGKVLWKTSIFKDAPGATTRMHQKNSHASPTPLIEGDRVYVHFGPLGTACLDLNGKIVWRNAELSYPPVHGSGGSPIIVDNALIFSCDGASEPFVVALDKNNGRVIWKVNRVTNAQKKFSFSTPLLITVNGRKEVISPGSNAVIAYDPKDGKEIWRVRYDGYSVVPRPIFGNGLLYMSTGFDRPVVLAIRPDGQGDVTDTHVAWRLAKGAPCTPSLLLVGDELYMVSDGGIGSCVDAKTGSVYWQERVCSGCSASPVYADGKIYVQDEQGLGVVLKPGKTFTKLASNALNERTLASYAIADGALFIRTAQNLYRIQGK